MQTHDVAGIGLVDHRFLLGHKRRGRGEFHQLAAAHVQIVMISLETARADFQKGDAVAVVGVHVGVYLEHEARHPLLRRLDRACKRRRRPGRRSDPHEAVEQLAHPEIVDRRTEEYGGQLAAQVGLPVERIVNPLHQLHVLAQLPGIAFGDAVVQLPGGEVADFDPLGVGRLPLVARKEREVALIEVINPLERRSVGDGEGKGPDTDLQLLLDPSSRSNGSLHGRSSLLMKTITGVRRIRQTFISLRVCVSTPFAPSITIITESTAVSVR